MVVLTAFMALSVDVGMLWSTRRTMQTAADAAALAGAEAIPLADNVNNGAMTASSINGFTNGSNGVTITVNNPPVSGPNTGNTNFVEVIVNKTLNTFFLPILGIKTANLSTRAVAGYAKSPQQVIGLSPDETGTVTVNGGNVSLGCGLISNSTSSSALKVNGGATLSATQIGVVGSYNGNGSNCSPTPKTGVAPVRDPLCSHHMPALSGCTRSGTTRSGTCEIRSSTTCAANVYAGSGYGQNNFRYRILDLFRPTSAYADGFGSGCGIGIASPYNQGTHTYTPINVTFSGGTYGNYINCGGDSSHTCQNSTITFNAGQYQCDSNGYYPSVQIGSYASGCTVNFNPGSYKFSGNVQICGNNTVTLQPGEYYGGITIQGNSGGGPTTVNFQPGTYIIGGGGLNASGNCILNANGCSFHNTKDISSMGFSNGPICIGAQNSDNCSLHMSAPTAGDREGMLFTQDAAMRDAEDPAHNCNVQCTSDSTCDGVLYFPQAQLTYCGKSSGSGGYTVLIADMVTITSNTSLTNVNANCDYSSLSHGSPLQTVALYE